jgi:REP element-mobilizing transposase RayT
LSEVTAHNATYRIQIEVTAAPSCHFGMPYHFEVPARKLALALNLGRRQSWIMGTELPQRRTPAKCVHISLGRPNWVFLTVCTERRGRWLAQPAVQRTLHDLWKNEATAWLVADYLLMPDHLHLFCAPRDLRFTIERWMAFWKHQFTRAMEAHCAGLKETASLRWQPQIPIGKFQRGGFHHRLRVTIKSGFMFARIRCGPDW